MSKGLKWQSDTSVWHFCNCSLHQQAENYNAVEIAKIATSHGLYEEVLTIYKKYDQHTMVIKHSVYWPWV